VSEPGDRPVRPGPLYDRATRRLVEADVAGFCAVLGVPIDPAVPGAGSRLPSTFPGTTRTPDLLVRLRPGQLLHVEYQTTAGRGLALRMLGYRAAIMDAHAGEALTQKVVVLGDGTLDSIDHEGFRLGCGVVHLRDLPPADLLTRSSLAPLAVLARGTQHQRAQALGAAVRLIRDSAGPRARELLEVATTLATIRLSPSTIGRIRQEAGMTVESIADFYEETDFGQEIRQRGRQAGRQEGRQEGREEGREEGLAVMLRERFGDHPDVPRLTAALAARPDLAAVYRQILAAATIEELAGAG
jgi:hypothetical protein